MFNGRGAYAPRTAKHILACAIHGACTYLALKRIAIVILVRENNELRKYTKDEKLRHGETCHSAGDPKDKELRSLVVEQVALVQSKTREVNRLHALFVQDGITTIRKKDLRSTEARNRCYTELSPSTLIRAHRLESLISVYEENLEEVEGRIRTLVADNMLTPYLMSIPGVRPNLIAAFIGYLGDGSRFSIDRVAAYAGLVPRIDCSGDKIRYGSITKTGCSVLRRALVQGAWGSTRSSYGGVLGRKYRYWVSTKGKSKVSWPWPVNFFKPCGYLLQEKPCM